MIMMIQSFFVHSLSTFCHHSIHYITFYGRLKSCVDRLIKIFYSERENKKPGQTTKKKKKIEIHACTHRQHKKKTLYNDNNNKTITLKIFVKLLQTLKLDWHYLFL